MDRDFVIICNSIFGSKAHLNNERQDPVFFEGAGEWVLHISYGEHFVYVYCDGDTRARLDTEVGIVELYATDDFIEAGLDTDKKLYEAEESGKLEWVNNSWFDMYGCELEHLDCVADSIEQAIEGAKQYLADRATSTDIIMGDSDLTLEV